MPIELSIPLGQPPRRGPLRTAAVQYFKRLAPNAPTASWYPTPTTGHAPGRRDPLQHAGQGHRLAAAGLPDDEGVIVDLSDAAATTNVYTSKMIEQRVEVKPGDILIIHTGYHHNTAGTTEADEIPTDQAPLPGPRSSRFGEEEEDPLDRVDCGSATTPSTPPSAAGCPASSRSARPLPREVRQGLRSLRRQQVQLMHIELFQPRIIARECLAATSTCCSTSAAPSLLPVALRRGVELHQPHRAIVDEKRHAKLSGQKKKANLTKFGDIAGAQERVAARARPQRTPQEPLRECRSTPTTACDPSSCAVCRSATGTARRARGPPRRTRRATAGRALRRGQRPAPRGADLSRHAAIESRNRQRAGGFAC
jgi:hypothetical protein